VDEVIAGGKAVLFNDGRRLDQLGRGDAGTDCFGDGLECSECGRVQVPIKWGGLCLYG
jgi:hypothetical protein